MVNIVIVKMLKQKSQACLRVFRPFDQGHSNLKIHFMHIRQPGEWVKPIQQGRHNLKKQIALVESVRKYEFAGEAIILQLQQGRLQKYLPFLSPVHPSSFWSRCWLARTYPENYIFPTLHCLTVNTPLCCLFPESLRLHQPSTRGSPATYPVGISCKKENQ